MREEPGARQMAQLPGDREGTWTPVQGREIMTVIRQCSAQAQMEMGRGNFRGTSFWTAPSTYPLSEGRAWIL